ncbi:MAG TPA: hypothetical protein VIV11_21000 [Kofleriaceae bacterium]
MRCTWLIAAFLPATAFADPLSVSPDEPSAAEVAAAPLPGRESGRTDQADAGDSLLRDIGQGALLVPRVAVEVTMAPVRATIWTLDRYKLIDRFKQVFFDDTETYGLYPTAVLDSSYGLTVGARLVHRNLFGEREHLAVRGGTGGEFRALAAAGLRTGDRFGERTELALRGEFERRPNDAFYGIGNSTDAMAAHHRQELVRGTVGVDVRAVRSLHLYLAGAVTDLGYAVTDDGVPIDVMYDPSVLAGWPGTRNLYGELELRWDGRGYPPHQDQHATYDRGWLIAAFAGRVHQLEAGRDHWRYGADVQHHWRIGAGPRALATRMHFEAVTGEISDVAFTQLPQLGGKALLRGYPRDRFRDRIATAGSLEYQWDLGRLLMASAFVDVGRVFPELREIQPTDLRLGYGMSLQLHSHSRFLASVSLASSIDGGFFIDFAFDPVFDLERRVEQR